jgi:hypothetical protein
MQLIIDQKKIKKTLIWVLGGILAHLIGQSTWFVENWYVPKFYPPWSNLLKKFSNFFPFSLGDLFYGILILGVVVNLLSWIYQFLKANQKSQKLWDGIQGLLQYCSIGYILFLLFWGYNYKRGGITIELGLNPSEYTQKEITDLTNQLIDSANFYRKKIGTTSLPDFSKETLIIEAQKAYNTASIEFPFLTTQIQSVKFSLYEPIADYVGFSGYFNPFTGEAHLRNDLPGILNPFIICHEVAHQLGYASESEASFVGYLAAKSSANIYLQYSMYLDLINYSLNEQYLLYAKDDYAKFEQVVKQNSNRMDSLVKKDRKDIREYFYKRRNIISPISNNLYDQFLKINQQYAGINSYNEVIAWLISYQKKKS